MRFRMAYASVLGANEMMSRSSAGANQGCQPRPLQWWHRFARQPALQSASAPSARPPGLPLCLPSRTGSAHLPGWPNAAPCPPSCRWDSGSSRPGSTQCGTARCSSPGPSSQTSAPPARHTTQALLAHSSSAAADEALVSIGPHVSPWEPGIAHLTLGGIAPAAMVASYRRWASPAMELLMSLALTVAPCRVACKQCGTHQGQPECTSWPCRLATATVSWCFTDELRSWTRLERKRDG